jgi:hypothetical protein
MVVAYAETIYQTSIKVKLHVSREIKILLYQSLAIIVVLVGLMVVVERLSQFNNGKYLACTVHPLEHQCIRLVPAIIP